MTRQQNVRQYHAAREGLLRRLMDELRIGSQAAERWLAAWGVEAERLNLGRSPEYWRQGSRWILEQVADGRQPPEDA